MLWKNIYSIEELNSRFINNIGTHLGIEFLEITENSLVATMPVDDRTRQPYGILHGGASVVLAETLGSIASNLIVEDQGKIGVGLEVNANHLRPVKDGLVRGVCTPIHIGAKTHVWDIKIYEKHGKLSCISRLTVAIIPKQG
jgi:1,4-dihydroxy-2-naphthoyl-CoA hydrolase